MREASFRKRNLNKWKQFEEKLSSKDRDADELSQIFIEVSDDLSFAQTFYPNSDIAKYLNQMMSKVYLIVYKNKIEKKSRFITFFTHEVPLLYWEHRKSVMISFIVFTISCLIGVFSAYHDDTFVRLILGDSYVNQTIDNIKNGTPLEIYNSQNELTMFLMITTNNIRVAFIAFALGLFSSLGTGFLLFRNGVMLGAFQYFFYQHNVFEESVRTIWVHGTFEISAIVLAGACGILLGNSFMYPGNYSRAVSFKEGAQKGVKMIVGLIPFFIVAGFLESFLTRHADTHPTIAYLIIFGSIITLIIYFFIHPYNMLKQLKHEQ